MKRRKAGSSRKTIQAKAVSKTKTRAPTAPTFSRAPQPADVVPGELFLAKSDIIAFEGRLTVELIVSNTGDRPIQIGSHCHFFEANRALTFDREKSYGFRLCIPAGT